MQRKFLKKYVPLKVSILITAAILLIFGGKLSANDYLDELAVEAEATASVSSKSRLSAAEKKQFKEMEALLEAEKPSTYKFYTKLNSTNKERAFEAFASDRSGEATRLSHLQKKVMDLYFSQ